MMVKSCAEYTNEVMDELLELAKGNIGAIEDAMMASLVKQNSGKYALDLDMVKALLDAPEPNENLKKAYKTYKLIIKE